MEWIEYLDEIGVRTATTNNATSISTETSRAQAEEARIEGLTANTVKYTEQTLTYLQQQQARVNIRSASVDNFNDVMDMAISLRRALYDETDRATQAESSISASIPTSAQISALAPRPVSQRADWSSDPPHRHHISRRTHVLDRQIPP